MKRISCLLLIVVFAITEQPVFCEETKGSNPPAGSIGSYQTSFSEFSPLAHTDEMFKRLVQPGMEQEYLYDRKNEYSGQDHPGYAFDVKDEIWNLYIPPSYHPQGKYGLFVWINADDNGAPTGDWKKVFAQKKMIFVGADRSGNDHDSILRRIALALHAAYNMTKQFSIDSNRIYVSGYSGGGRTASWLAMGYGDIFSGALYICGCNAPGGERVKPPSKEFFRKVKENNRYVFMTGDQDMNREDTRSVMEEYKRFHIRNINYIQVPGMGHDIPNSEWLGKAIDMLDFGPKEKPKTSRKTSNQTGSLPPLKLKFE